MILLLNISFLDLEHGNPGTIFYFIIPDLAIIINIVCKLYSSYLSQTLENTAASARPNMRFGFSLCGSILIGMPIFLGTISSFLARKYRIFFIYPSLVTIYSVFVPLYIICRNRKMKKIMMKIAVQMVVENFWKLKSQRMSASVGPTIA